MKHPLLAFKDFLFLLANRVNNSNETFEAES